MKKITIEIELDDDDVDIMNQTNQTEKLSADNIARIINYMFRIHGINIHGMSFNELNTKTYNDLNVDKKEASDTQPNRNNIKREKYDPERYDHFEKVKAIIVDMCGISNVSTFPTIPNIFSSSDFDLMRFRGASSTTPFYIMRTLLIFNQQLVLPLHEDDFIYYNVFVPDVYREHRFYKGMDNNVYTYKAFPSLVYRMYVKLHDAGFLTSLDDFYAMRKNENTLYYSKE